MRIPRGFGAESAVVRKSGQANESVAMMFWIGMF